MDKARFHYKELLDTLYDGVYFVDRDRRIRYWNKAAEKMTGYTLKEVLGKPCAENILKHIDEHGANLCAEGCPLAKTLLDGKLREAEIFCHHKKGHRLPISVRVAPVTDGNGRIVGAVESFSDNSPRAAILARIEELEKLALLDPLTRLANRRYIEIALQGRLEEMRRYGWPFGVLSLDIDHFKEVNDNHGHPAGDEVLKAVANTLIHNARVFDAIGRWGGEEFIGIISNADDKRLLAVAERFRALVGQSHVPADGATIRVTISIGATLAKAGDTVDTLIARADQLMYQSKKAGRNKVTLG